MDEDGAGSRRWSGCREKSRRLQRLRSERMERSFAHVCNTGGARRTQLRGVENVQKRYLITLAGRNLTVLMRALFGIGTPRSLQGLSAAIFAVIGTLVGGLWKLRRPRAVSSRRSSIIAATRHSTPGARLSGTKSGILQRAANGARPVSHLITT